jgi:hypothetical protein
MYQLKSLINISDLSRSEGLKNFIYNEFKALADINFPWSSVGLKYAFKEIKADDERV